MSNVSDMSTSLPAPRRAGTIYDIAREAGVSHQSVSRFMRGFALRAATRTRIEAALETLEYKPNLTARSLVTGKSHRIGALTHEINQVGPATILQGASAAARDAGYLLDIVTLDVADAREIDQALELLLQHDLAGVIALSSTDHMRAAFADTSFAVPAVLAGESDEPDDRTSDTGGWEAISLAVNHLATLGHRQFLHLSGPVAWSAARNRRRSYERAVQGAGAVSLGILEGDWSAQSAYDAITQLSADALPTAIVAANDQMALGAMHALHARELMVPEAISVTGVDNTPESAFYSPALTTVSLDFFAQGQAAVHALLQRIDDTPPPTTNVTVAQLITRRSTGPAPHVRTSSP